MAPYQTEWWQPETAVWQQLWLCLYHYWND